MDVLPQFLYLFQTIPIHIPTSYFKKLRQLFSSFIWGATRPRIKYETLALLKTEEAARASDTSLYHKAAVLIRIVDWFHHTKSKTWVQLENHLNPIELCALLWTPAASRGNLSLVADLTRQMIQIWDRTIQPGTVSKQLGPMTPFSLGLLHSRLP